MKKFIAAITVLALPAIASAQYLGQGPDARDLVNRGVSIIGWLPGIFISIMVVILLYNIMNYVVKGGDAEAKKKALSGIGFSFLGLALALAAWGVITFIVTTAGLKVGGTVGGAQGQYIPKTPTQNLTW